MLAGKHVHHLISVDRVAVVNVYQCDFAEAILPCRRERERRQQVKFTDTIFVHLGNVDSSNSTRETFGNIPERTASRCRVACDVSGTPSSAVHHKCTSAALQLGSGED